MKNISTFSRCFVGEIRKTLGFFICWKKHLIWNHVHCIITVAVVTVTRNVSQRLIIGNGKMT